MTIVPMIISNGTLGTIAGSGVLTSQGSAFATEILNGGSQLAHTPGQGLPIDLLNGGTVSIAGITNVGTAPAVAPISVAGVDAGGLKRHLLTDAAGVQQVNQIINAGTDESVNLGVTVNAGTIIYSGTTLTAQKTIAAGGGSVQIANGGTSIAIVQEGTGTAATFWPPMNAGDVALYPTADQVIIYAASGQWVAARRR